MRRCIVTIVPFLKADDIRSIFWSTVRSTRAPVEVRIATRQPSEKLAVRECTSCSH